MITSLELYRLRYSDLSTQGVIYLGPVPLFTLEPPKSSGKLMPEGTYRCIKTMSADMRYTSPELQGVPGHIGERIHIGNSANDTQGCILVGLSCMNDWVGSSHDAFEELMQLTPDEFPITISGK